MAEETPPVDEMNYEQLAQDAKRGIIRSALERAAMPEGIPRTHARALARTHARTGHGRADIHSQRCERAWDRKDSIPIPWVRTVYYVMSSAYS